VIDNGKYNAADMKNGSEGRMFFAYLVAAARYFLCEKKHFQCDVAFIDSTAMVALDFSVI
jgi:hypothetical protein